MKKLFFKCLLAVLSLPLVFTACGDKSSAGEDEKITLTLWHSFSADISGPIIKDFIAQYERGHPGIKIQEEFAQVEEYQFRKLKVAITNGSQGDVFLSYGGGYSKSFIDARAALPLSSYLEADGTYDRMQEGVLEYATYGGEVYGLPIKKWAGVLYCNSEYFAKYNVEYPETWDQLLAAVKIFRANGITPLTLGAKDGWHIGMYQNALAVRTAGADYCNEAIVGRATLDTPEIVQSARLLRDLVDAGGFDPGILAISADEANMEFTLGNIPMYYSGSWTAAQCEDPELNLKGKVRVFPMPEVEGGKGGVTQFLGGVIEFYMINSKTKYPDEAAAFAIGFAEYQSNEGYIIGDSVTAWISDIDESRVNPVLLEINKLTARADKYVLAWDTFLTGSAIDAHYNLLQQLVGRAITPAEFARKMQEANAAAIAETGSIAD
jgi:raffinose/stachyose/melibiose transport system substrate-binding protein